MFTVSVCFLSFLGNDVRVKRKYETCFRSRAKRIHPNKEADGNEAEKAGAKHGIKSKTHGGQHQDCFHHDDAAAVVGSFSVHLPKSVLFFQVDIIKKKKLNRQRWTH